MRHIHCDKCKREMIVPEEGIKAPYDLTHCYRLDLQEQPCNPSVWVYSDDRNGVTFDLCSTCADDVCKFIEDIK
jgi:hypothetical protein